MGDNPFEYRKILLLEQIKNLTQLSDIDLNDKAILYNIYDYIELLKKYQNNKKSFSEFQKLNELHNYFYGIDFDFTKDSTSQIQNNSDIYQIFKKNFNIIEKIIKENDNITNDLLNNLIPLLTIYYNKKQNKQEVLNSYLEKIIIPAVISQKKINSTNDDFVKDKTKKEIEQNLATSITKKIEKEEKEKEIQKEKELQQKKQLIEEIEKKKEIQKQQKIIEQRQEIIEQRQEIKKEPEKEKKEEENIKKNIYEITKYIENIDTKKDYINNKIKIINENLSLIIEKKDIIEKNIKNETIDNEEEKKILEKIKLLKEELFKIEKTDNQDNIISEEINKLDEEITELNKNLRLNNIELNRKKEIKEDLQKNTTTLKHGIQTNLTSVDNDINVIEKKIKEIANNISEKTKNKEELQKKEKREKKEKEINEKKENIINEIKKEEEELKNIESNDKNKDKYIKELQDELPKIKRETESFLKEINEIDNNNSKIIKKYDTYEYSKNNDILEKIKDIKKYQNFILEKKDEINNIIKKIEDINKFILDLIISLQKKEKIEKQIKEKEKIEEERKKIEEEKKINEKKIKEKKSQFQNKIDIIKNNFLYFVKNYDIKELDFFEQIKNYFSNLFTSKEDTNEYKDDDNDDKINNTYLRILNKIDKIINNNQNSFEKKEEKINSIINIYIYTILNKKHKIDFDNIIKYISNIKTTYNLSIDEIYLTNLNIQKKEKENKKELLEKEIEELEKKKEQLNVNKRELEEKKRELQEKIIELKEIEEKLFSSIIDILFNINLNNLVNDDNDKSYIYILINILILKKNNILYKKNTLVKKLINKVINYDMYIYYNNDFLYQNYYNILNYYSLNKNNFIDKVYFCKILNIYLNSIFNNNNLNFENIYNTFNIFKNHLNVIINNEYFNSNISKYSYFKNNKYVYTLFKILYNNKNNNDIIKYIYLFILYDKDIINYFKELINIIDNYKDFINNNNKILIDNDKIENIYIEYLYDLYNKIFIENTKKLYIIFKNELEKEEIKEEIKENEEENEEEIKKEIKENEDEIKKEIKEIIKNNNDIYKIINEFINNLLEKEKSMIEKNEKISKIEKILNNINIITSKQTNNIVGGKIIKLSNNDIKLIDIYKFYYNYISIYNDENRIINNIYKLYFIINIYSNYYKNTDKYNIINKIKDIINNNNYKNHNINELIDNINKETEEIYKEYIKLIERNDNIIKYYYVEYDKYNDYLNINFIYNIYKNIEEEDINIKIDIDENEILINKSYNEIKEELKDFIKNREYILYTNDLINKTSNIIYKEDIKYLINYIYYYSKNNEIIIDNINDLLNYIVIKILTCVEEKIILNINNIKYEIKNIKNHLYKINNDDKEDKKIKIELNKKEEYLIKKLLNDNSKYLFAILANEYYYINFDLLKKFKYNIYINNEIIDLIEINRENNRNLINYSFYDYMSISKLNNYSIINTNNNQILLIINYSILLSSSIYTNINLYNYISLIYIYFILKKIKEEINEIKEYNGNNIIINNYKEFLLSVDIIQYIKRCIIEIQSKLTIKYDINKYIYHILNFKENKFINNLNIKPSIDIKFITNLYENNEIIIKDNIYYDDIYKCLILILKICIIPNIDNYKYFNDILKIEYIYLLPILKELSITNININSIEKIVISIKVNDILLKIKNNKKIFGGNDDKLTNIDINYSNIEDSKEDNKEDSKEKNKENDKKNNLLDVRVSTNESLSIDDMIKNLELIAVIEKKIKSISLENYKKIFIQNIDKFSSYNIQNIKNKYYKKDNEEKKDNEKKKDNEEKKDNEDNYESIFEQNLINYIPDFSKDEFTIIIAEINTLIDNKVKSINEELNIYNNNKSEFQKNIGEIESDIDKLKEFVKLLEQYKGSNDKNIINIISKFEITNKEKIDIFDIKKKTIIDNLEDYINIFKNIIDLYILSLNEILNIYLSIKDNIKIMISQYNIYLNNKGNKEKKYDGGYINYLIKRGGKKTFTDLNNLPLNIQKFKEIINNKNEDNKNEILEKIDDIKKDYKKLKTSNIIPESIEKDLVLKNFIDKEGNNLFEKILYQYDNDYKETTEEIANENLYNNIINNNLDPEIELKINIYDKLIFLLIVFLLRIVVIYITNYLIDIGTITNIKIAIYYYTLFYLIIYILIVIIINIDIFRLRLLINYLNMHINSVSIFNHFIINIIISYIVYLLIINLTNDKDRTKLSNNEKIKLKYKINILTITIIIFIIIMVLVI